MPTAVIYSRVSRDAGREARSVAEQETECRAWADREGWGVEGGPLAWSDNDRSASRYAKRERESWQALMTRLERGGVDLLLVWEPSRATRDRRVWAALAATCEAQGTRIGCNGRVYDLDDPDDAFALDLFFALAARESGTTRKRVERSMRANADSGRPHGKVLYGYRREYEPTPNGKPRLLGQVPDEVTAPVVHEIARRVLAGETPYAVAADLNARKVPTPRGGPRGWDLTQVRRVCVNPAYAGKRVHRGHVVGEASWPALLDEATHAALVARLSDPARRTQRDSAVRHLLSGIALCGVCGDPMRVQRNRGQLAYACTAGGFHVSRSEDRVDAVVTVAAVDRLARPDLFEQLARDEDSAVRSAIADAQALRDRLTGFYDEAAAGALSPAALARIEAQLLPQLEAAESRARQVVLSPLVAEVGGPDAEARWEGLSIPQRRELIRALMTVRILPAGRGRRVFDPKLIEITWRAGE